VQGSESSCYVILGLEAAFMNLKTKLTLTKIA
jgi:hypothetical protein